MPENKTDLKKKLEKCFLYMSFTMVSTSKVKSENYTSCSLHAAVLYNVSYFVPSVKLPGNNTLFIFLSCNIIKMTFQKNYGNENGRCATKVTTNLSILLSAF